MLTKPKMMWAFLAVVLTAASNPAHAEDAATAPAPPAAQSTAESGGFLDSVKKYGKASYLAWLIGPRTEALSGNRTGAGTALELDHFFSVGADIGKGLTLKTTFLAQQFIDEKSEQEKKQFQFADPYIALSHGKILHSDRYAANLEGLIRYYVPISRGTIDGLNKGATRDNGYGRVRLLVNPSKSFLDGKLTFNGTMLGHIYFNKLSDEERLARSTRQSLIDSSVTPSGVREDYNFILDPSVVYSLSPKVDVYLEWSTGYLRHTTNGKWSSVNHPDDGAYLSPGIYWSPTKRIFLNPYLSYQLSAAPADRGLTKMDVGLQAQYTFL